MVNTCAEGHWYLAQLKPNSYRIAERHLARQDIAFFLPMHSRTERVRGQFKTVTKPMFPGYIFVQLDPGAGTWRQVNATQGITRLVQFGETPRAVPDGLVPQLMAHCAAADGLASGPELKAGDSVTLTQGPFATFIATVEALPDEKRVWVLLDLMGRSTRVAVARDHLRAV